MPRPALMWGPIHHLENDVVCGENSRNVAGMNAMKKQFSTSGL
jgi:hypothetical protein